MFVKTSMTEMVLDFRATAGDEYTLYNYFKFGFQLSCHYEQNKKLTDVMGVTYNTRTQKLVLLDSRGITLWCYESAMPGITRVLNFPKYQSHLLKSLLFCQKYNVYFAICHDFSLQVLNKDFEITCKAETPNMRSILHIVFNPKTDELLTAGVAGVTVWKYELIYDNAFDEIKPMANYSLFQIAQHKNVGGGWCTRVDLIVELQQVCFCSENHLYVYKIEGMKLLFIITNAHSSMVTCVGCCIAQKLLITGGMDSEIKIWGGNGSHIHSFRGHSKPITSLVVHPSKPDIVLTSSLDGNLKVWSLQIMELLYTFNVFADGVDWMSITPEGDIWCATARKVEIYDFQFPAKLWGYTDCNIGSLQVSDDFKKSKRVVAVGQDYSVRLFSQFSTTGRALCTILAPPVISPKESIMKVAYGRHNSLIYILIDKSKLWIYTGKTDPACKVAEWNVSDILNWPDVSATTEQELKPQLRKKLPSSLMHQPAVNLSNYFSLSGCNCIATAHSVKGFNYVGKNGHCSTLSRHVLLMGLEDGRIIFLDQTIKCRKLLELPVSKHAVHDIKFMSDDGLIISQSGLLSLVIQGWSLPDFEVLFKINVPSNLTAFCFFSKMLVAGYTNGVVTVWNLNEQKEDDLESIAQNKTQFELHDADNVTSQVAPLEADHTSRVFEIEACVPRAIFLSSSVDGVIKIWTYDKVLLTKVCLDDTLNSCTFLNPHGDLLVGWKRHAFMIDHALIIPSTHEIKEDDTEKVECDSVIYEDPGLHNDFYCVKVTDGPLDMHKYLMPYSFIMDDTAQLDKFIVEADVELKRDSESHISVYAPTEVYLSPVASNVPLIDDRHSSQTNIRRKETTDASIDFPILGASPDNSSSSFDSLSPSSTYGEKGLEEIILVREQEETALDLSQQIGTSPIAVTTIAKTRSSSPQTIDDIDNTNYEVLSSQQIEEATSKNVTVKKKSTGTQLPMQKERTKRGRRLATIKKNWHPKIKIQKGADMLPIENKDAMLDKGNASLVPTENDSMGTEISLKKNVFISKNVLKKKNQQVDALKKSLNHKVSGSQEDSTQRKDKDIIKFMLLKDAEHHITKSPIDQLKVDNAHAKPITQVQLKYKSISCQDSSTTIHSEKENNIGKIICDTQESAHTKKERSMHLVEQLETDPSHKPIHHISLNKRDAGFGDEYDADEMPDFLSLDFQAVYKKDGLQFDDDWQKRMLDRYLLKKLQRDERTAACARKRFTLERERLHKIFSHRPELMYSHAYAWYENHNRLADYILRSPLLTGEQTDIDLYPPKEMQVPISALVSSRVAPGSSSGRPPSAADGPRRAWSQKSKRGINDEGLDYSTANAYRTHRFSLRERRLEQTERKGKEKENYLTTAKSLYTVNNTVSANPNESHLAGVTSTSRPLTLVRPRSSRSIPGKTRYILIRTESNTNLKSRTPTPSKTEDDLMRKRFPAQYQALLRSQHKNERINNDTSNFEEGVNVSRSMRTRSLHSFTPLQHISRPTSSASKAVSLDLSNIAENDKVKTPPVAPKSSVISSSILDNSPIAVLHRKSVSYIPSRF